MKIGKSMKILIKITIQDFAQHYKEVYLNFDISLIKNIKLPVCASFVIKSPKIES